jgi:cytidylate kinase
MLKKQRYQGRGKNCVLEGRDIGTVVFPGAEKKFYIDADFKKRVRRRHKELKATNSKKISLKDVAIDLHNRDRIDSTRKFAPLRKAKDAIYVDTTRLNINQVVNRLLNYVR